MDDLVAWLRAQLDEDESEARDWPGEEDVRWHRIPGYTPARVLREVEAKRTIVGYGEHFSRGAARSPDDDVLRGNANAYRVVLRVLAEAYADRAGYRSEWKP